MPREQGKRVRNMGPPVSYVVNALIVEKIREKGKGGDVLQKIMGHANISITAIYMHVQEDAAVDTAHIRSIASDNFPTDFR